MTGSDGGPEDADPPTTRSPGPAASAAYVLLGAVSAGPGIDEEATLMRTTRHTLADEGHRGGIDVRVSLRSDAGSGEQAFDGAWFPRSRDLAVELPELVAALDKRGLRIERFTYPLDVWSPAPRKVVVGGRVIRTGGFRSMDAGVVCLTWAGGTRRADLLVVPPETDVITGARALRLCTRRGLPRSPQMVLAAARSTPLPQVPVGSP